MWKMVEEALGTRISKCHKENALYFSKDLERLQIVDNAPGGCEPKGVSQGVSQALEVASQGVLAKILFGFALRYKRPQFHGIHIGFA